MATVPGIMVDIGANVARMQQDMRRLTSMMESGFGQIESMAKKVGGILAGAFSINALVDYAKQAIETGDRMAKMSQSAGVSVEAISSLAYAAKLSNVELEGLAKGLGILSRNMLEAQGGTGEAKDAIKALNLSITDSSGTLLSSDKMLAQVADKFAGMQDGAGKTALAMKLFGRSGAELIPLLNQGSAGLAELRAEAEKMGLVLSEDTAQQMERVNDNFIRLKAASQGAAMVIMAGVAPTLENLTNILIDARKSVGGFSAVIEATAGGLRTLASTGVIAWTVFKDLGEGFNAIAAAAVTAAEGDFSTAWKILNMEGEDSRKMWGETGQVLAKIWDKSAEDALRSATKIRKGLGAAPALPTEDEKNIEKRLKALQEEAEATQLGTDALDLYKKGFAEATAEQRDFALYLLRTIDAYEQSKKSILDLVKAEEEDRKVILENESAIFSMVDALKMQAIATGMSEEETFKFQLILKGASKSIIENADAYFAAIRAAKQYNDQIELVKGVIEETKSPMDRYEERMKEIQSLLDQGFISPQKALQAQAVAWDKMIGKEKETFAERERILIDFGDRVRAQNLFTADAAIAQIERQSAIFLKAGADDVAVAMWAAKEKQKASHEWQDGATRGLQDYAASALNAAKNTEEFFTKSFKGMEDALVDFVKTGKLDFSKFIDSVIADLARLVIRETITGPLARGTAGAISGWGAWIASLFGGGGGGETGTLEQGMPGGYRHGGGIIGDLSVSQKMFPAALLMSSPRYHAGLQPDEFPTILKRGEGVFTPEQMKALGGENTISIPISITMPGGDSRKNSRMARDLENEIEPAVRRIIQRYV